jgi:hypothetical protein
LSLWSICTKHGQLLQTCTPHVSNVMILKVVIQFMEMKRHPLVDFWEGGLKLN